MAVYKKLKAKVSNHFSKLQLSIFTILFAGIGGYFIVSSFAAITTCDSTLTAGANVSSAIAGAGSGSTICLHGGNYSGFRIAKESTNKTSYVTIVSFPGETANFTSNITFDNARYIRLENLKINGGLNFTPAGSNIEVKGNEITGSVGIYMFGDYRTVAQGGSSTSCPCEVTNVNIENNNIHDIDYTGSQGPGGGVGITGVGDTYNVTVKGNTIKSVASDYIQSGMIHDWNVDGNTFLGPSLQFPNHPTDHQDLWQIFGCDTGCYDTNHLIYNIKFNNNVARSTGTAESLLFQTAYFKNVEVTNNLFDKDSRGTTIQIYNTDSLTYRYNTHIEEAESTSANQGALFRDGGGTAGMNYQVDHNIFVKLRGSGTAIGTEGRAGTWGTYDYNVSSDSSASGANSTRNWTPNWVDQINYQPVGLQYDAGYKPGRFSTPTPKPGDTNGDNLVNIIDLSTLLSKWNTNFPSADFNKDNTVNIIDLSVLLSNYGTGSNTLSCTDTIHKPGGSDGNGKCWPGPNNTGVPAGTTLSAYTGPKIITTANTVIDSKIITSGLDIRAPGVIVRKSKISGVGAGEDVIAIDTSRTSASVTIEDSEIDAGQGPYTGIGDINWVAKRVKIYNGHRGVHCYDNCTLEDSYLFDQWAAVDGSTHESGARMGQRSTFKHNTLWCNAPDIPPDGGCSANLTGYGDWTTVHDNRIEANLFMATTGGYCAYGGSSASKPYPNAYNIVFINNVFGRRPDAQNNRLACGYYGTISDFNINASGNQWINNKYDNGVTVTP